jgi:hypothetical protein
MPYNHHNALHVEALLHDAVERAAEVHRLAVKTSVAATSVGKRTSRNLADRKLCTLRDNVAAILRELDAMLADEVPAVVLSGKKRVISTKKDAVTDDDRAAAACAYDKSYSTNTPDDTAALKTSDYDVDGALVTLRDGGTTYWVVTKDEAAEIGIAADSAERFDHAGRVWLIDLA